MRELTLEAEMTTKRIEAARARVMDYASKLYPRHHTQVMDFQRQRVAKLDEEQRRIRQRRAIAQNAYLQEQSLHESFLQRHRDLLVLLEEEKVEHLERTLDRSNRQQFEVNLAEELGRQAVAALAAASTHTSASRETRQALLSELQAVSETLKGVVKARKAGEEGEGHDDVSGILFELQTQMRRLRADAPVVPQPRRPPAAAPRRRQPAEGPKRRAQVLKRLARNAEAAARRTPAAVLAGMRRALATVEDGAAWDGEVPAADDIIGTCAAVVSAAGPRDMLGRAFVLTRLAVERALPESAPREYVTRDAHDRWTRLLRSLAAQAAAGVASIDDLAGLWAPRLVPAGVHEDERDMAEAAIAQYVAACVAARGDVRSEVSSVASTASPGLRGRVRATPPPISVPAGPAPDVVPIGDAALPPVEEEAAEEEEEEEQRRKEEEEENRKREEEEKKKEEEEEERKRKEEEEERRAKKREQEEERRRKEAEEIRRKEDEEEMRRKAEEEEAERRRVLEEEEERRKEAEKREEELKREEREAERKRKEEEEVERKCKEAEEERKRKEDEDEDERHWKEAEARRRAEAEETRRLAEARAAAALSDRTYMGRKPATPGMAALAGASIHELDAFGMHGEIDVGIVGSLAGAMESAADGEDDEFDF